MSKIIWQDNVNENLKFYIEINNAKDEVEEKVHGEKEKLKKIISGGACVCVYTHTHHH